MTDDDRVMIDALLEAGAKMETCEGRMLVARWPEGMKDIGFDIQTFHLSDMVSPSVANGLLSWPKRNGPVEWPLFSKRFEDIS